MSKDYHHLTRDQRCQIDILLKRNISLTEIAKMLRVHRSTISRELKRNSIKHRSTSYRIYDYREAQRKALRRRREVSSRPNKLDSNTKELIISKICLQWSPEQISGWMKRHGYPSVSHETIYKTIWKDKRKGGKLYQNLRRYGKKYKKRSGTRSKHSAIPNRVDIDERPDIVKLKNRIGDWELDTILGKGHHGAVITIVDRASKLTKMYQVDRKTASNVANGITSKLKPIREFVITLTADNGGEFAQHERVAEQLAAQFYFSKPYHSWERGLNEHTNGLIRQYLPKNESLAHLTQERTDEIENLLNNRPRKVLNYMTPIEAFDSFRQRSPCCTS